ncbi:hypothetical protein [Halalkalicoccus jeotgali]|uniref:Uncharacterized protein n=1 Tax=Halalkalicoccus jeotgali (strain DSM 18796 / CECT 7217 / JCM 14584 / KCTC 4019 / B3) TaxID=795797 RepID=D8J670_HALJB|nr:hypothetical protein [Halalkalicoccus jeotgali]ADJ15788.1 hypothetical protein HacjB3_12025 [Halalkalicoccus jeotgali B3]ELY37188.1 hypothetical protein C497_10603 [Halalkalicoccus jeotgali B3]
MTDPSFLDRVRQPAHTGRNRCVPCTVLNAAIALLASAVVALVSVPLAAVTLLASVLSISLRGYLVPGTPRLTERYLPECVLARFDTHPIEERRPDDRTAEGDGRRDREAVDPERFLLRAGAIEPDERGDDLRLTEGFSRLIERQRPDHGDPTDRDAIARLLDVDPGAVAVLDREYPAVETDRRVRKWPSEAALVADALADGALCDLTGRWERVPLDQRLGILRSLRSFHPTCPRCSGEIVLSEGTVESCCRTHEVLALGCEACGPLLEFSPEQATPVSGRGVRP